MRRTTIAMVAAMAAGLGLLTACAESPERVGGAAQPAGGIASASSAPATQASSTTPSAPATSAPASPSHTTKPVATDPVFGPTRLGALKIGMTWDAAKATGQVTAVQKHDYDACSSARLKGAPTDDSEDNTLIFSPDQGLIYIPAYGKFRTPESIHIGSTLAQVKKTYPDFEAVYMEDGVKPGDTGRARAAGSDGNGVHYRLSFVNGKLTRLGLELDNQNCYE
ncbi:hypothetical protein GCM10023107_34760 [Actinoplanes octamycinicus]|nr:hypothetical protein Aoc01nite_27980 [Actinoplanes octamycinicus]